MSEVTEKLSGLRESQSSKTFKSWVEQFEEDDQDAINDALANAYESRSYAPVFEILKGLDHNRWWGEKDALIKYCNRKFGA